MFSLHKHRNAKPGDKVDFRLSQLKALQVVVLCNADRFEAFTISVELMPKGWDKLFVSIVSVETGKAIAKSSKAIT
ncbi:hypothetical protein FEM48_Zijuj12G0049600 [Ziziphus jujuba var. spinosa]|uniref:Uncharacterized protein n=1 Tax=Ziziphus jujuba var. spinosa TaxID=714518 RepID=A0A978UBB0_ZIZJJ|nr:hypothetical protein FEM48_Zijuj12G0049600 [Ziziphus jujuba var. spinosa]